MGNSLTPGPSHPGMRLLSWMSPYDVCDSMYAACGIFCDSTNRVKCLRQTHEEHGNNYDVFELRSFSNVGVGGHVKATLPP
jgi:hypothetical protein